MRSGRMMLGFVAGLVCLGGTGAWAEVGSVMTYQGRLNQDGAPLDGSADFRCTLYDADLDGTAVAGPLEFVAVTVADGLFTLPLDFGAVAFNGGPRWLEIEVASPSGGTYTTLTPRQSITATPYALRTRGLNVDEGGNLGIRTESTIAPLTVLGANDINGTAWFTSPKGPHSSHIHYGDKGDWYLRSADSAGKVILQDTGGNVGIGTSAPAARLHLGGTPGTDGIMFPDGTLQTTAASAGWSLSGNSDTNPGVHFVGTTDQHPLSFRVNNTQALRLQYGSDGSLTGVNVIGGAGSNSIPNNVIGATVFGGTSFVGNSVGANWSTVAGGLSCSIASSADKAFLGGGQNNSISGSTSVLAGGASNAVAGVYGTISGGLNGRASAWYSTVGGGNGNNASGSAATISGGQSNNASGGAASIGGGQNNNAGGTYGHIGGGSDNVAPALGSTVAGGQSNRAGVDGGDDFATVGGGNGNIAGWRATVAGGAGNQATGDWSAIAGGDRNQATHVASAALGGTLNVASGQNATTLGGSQNTASSFTDVTVGGYFNRAAGGYSLAAGYGAKADHIGSFVWSGWEDPHADFVSTARSQFLVRAAGGVGINMNAPTTALHVNGTITGSVKNFVIDHPLDPANWTLRHACIESDEMLNLYSGNVVTDQEGYATVTVPNWFTALNTDFRYQLTVVEGGGDEFVQVRVARKIENDRFVIRATHANVEISWQITGLRNDAYARAHPLSVEEAKPEFQRGYYLNPEAHGQPESLSVNHAPVPGRVKPASDVGVDAE